MAEKAKLDIKKLLNTDISTLFQKKSIAKPKSKAKAPSKEIKKDLLVFDIGQKSIKFIVGKRQKDLISIKQMGEVPTTQDSILDGRVINEATLSNTLKMIVNDKEIKAKDVAVTINSSQIINRELMIQAVDEDEMETVIRYELQQYLPINLNDYQVQYSIIEAFEQDDIQKLKVFVIAFPERLAKSYYQLVKAADLKPFALETSFVSLDKLLSHINMINEQPFNSDEVTAFLDLGASTIDVNIYRNGKIDLTRIIKAGGDNLDYMLSQRHEIHLQSALTVKKKIDLATTSDDELTQSTRLAVDNLIFEIDRILQFYRNKNFQQIDRVYLYGGAALLKGLDVYMGEKLGLKVEMIYQIDGIEFKGESQLVTNYLNTIGATIRG